ncbi:MAG: 4Fe-4S dicluster domain-containing protein [Phycisphaeraceae bacterium]
MDDQTPPPLISTDRRSFFRQLLLRGVTKAEKVAHAVGNRFDKAMQQTERQAAELPAAGDQGEPRAALRVVPAAQAVPRGQATVVLRPPGALPGDAFADACSRCGDCVRACPAQCILLDEEHVGDDAGAESSGLPHIIARTSPCIVCNDLSCMKACPTGALKLVEQVQDIAMGLAVVDHTSCLRTGAYAEDCELCITPCPLGQAAIGLDTSGRIEVRDGCIGCGICERACPTEPASITVRPLS